MTFSYHADGYTLTDKDHELIESKLSKVAELGGRVTDPSTKVHIKVYRGKRHNSPNVGIHAHFAIPRGELDARASGPTLREALDNVERKLQTQTQKTKKVIEKKRRPTRD